MSIITNKYSYQKHPDGDDNPFDDDYLMQVHNRKAAITADDAYEDYSNPDTRRRDRTRAPEIFKYVDDTKQYQGIAVDDDKHYEKLALDFGTSYDLARRYNLGGQMDKDRIKQGVNTALEWEAKATGKQRAVQRNAAEMIGNYNMVSNAPKMGMDYTDMGGLTPYEAEAFFNGTPNYRKSIAAPLNAAMQPWLPAARPSLDAASSWAYPKLEMESQNELGNALSLKPDRDLDRQRYGTEKPEQYAANSSAATSLSAQGPTSPSKPIPPISQSQSPPSPRQKPPVPYYPKPPMMHRPLAGGERNDDEGKGWYDAPRDGGRSHEGLDILGQPGKPVVSPIDGEIVHRGIVYPKDKTDKNPALKAYRTIHIEGTGQYKGAKVVLFYVDGQGPKLHSKVRGGKSVLGNLQDVGKGHGKPKMQPHVHMRVFMNGVEFDPASVLPNWQTSRPQP